MRLSEYCYILATIVACILQRCNFQAWHKFVSSFYGPSNKTEGLLEALVKPLQQCHATLLGIYVATV